MTLVTPDQIKREYVNAMGNPLGELFFYLSDEVSALHMYWSEYMELYGKSEERVALLNHSASGFFWIVQKVLIEYVVLHITRLLDAPKAGKQARATLKALPALVDASLKPRVNEELIAIGQHTAFCWDWRDRTLAHRDLALAMNGPVTPLKQGSREEIARTLEGMANLLRLVRTHYGMPDISFDLASPLRGAEDLLRKLQGGIMMRTLRNEQMKSGQVPYGGYRLPDV